jgi:hypothetical protein
LLFIALNAEHAMWDKGFLPREGRGTLWLHKKPAMGAGLV